VARLEAGDHEPTVSTLAHLAGVLGLDFSIEIKRGHVGLRRPALAELEPAVARKQVRRAGKPSLSQEVREWRARQSAEA